MNGTIIHEVKLKIWDLSINIFVTSVPISNWWLNLVDSSSKIFLKSALSSPLPVLKSSLTWPTASLLTGSLMGSYPALAMPWPPDSPGPQTLLAPSPQHLRAPLLLDVSFHLQVPPRPLSPTLRRSFVFSEPPVYFVPHSPCFCTLLLWSVWNVLFPLSDLLSTGSHLRILLLSSEFSWVFLLSSCIGLLREGSNKMAKKGRLSGVLCPKHPPYLWEISPYSQGCTLHIMCMFAPTFPESQLSKTRVNTCCRC